MSRTQGLIALALLFGGCSTPPPRSVVSVPAPPVVVNAPSEPKIAAPPLVALVEPYWVAVPLSRPIYPAPPSSMRGDILPERELPNAPLVPSPPTVTVPIVPKPTPAQPVPAPTPRRAPALPTAVVRLFEEERARSVDEARRRVAAATARASQAASEAKRLWGFVHDGFVAQKQAENADAATRDAVAAQAEAQKSFDDAQQRQRDARRDVEAALRAVAQGSTMSLVQRIVPLPTYRPIPGLFRLAVLGTAPVSVAIQNGTLNRRLVPERGEAGAWLVKTADPSKLRVGVGTRPATVIVRGLPLPNDGSKV